MAPNRSLQVSRSRPDQLSSNKRTTNERERRKGLSKTQADYERQKKADWQHIHDGVIRFEKTAVYRDAATPGHRHILRKAEQQRLEAVRILEGNHHSLMPTDYAGRKPVVHMSSWKDGEPKPEDDFAPHMKIEWEEEQKRIKAEAKDVEEPKIKQEPLEPQEPWALGNIQIPTDDF